MISVEDADGLIEPSIRQFIDIQQAKVLDVGTGTGRLPLLFSRHTQNMVGVDIHFHMLLENQRQRRLREGSWTLVHADLRDLPFKKKSFNMVTAGWALGHFCSWFPDNWRQEIDNALAAMSSVLKRDGAIVILETLTTGSLTPAPPTKTLGLYYDHLENEHGFIRTEIRTDYLFSSVDEAVELMEFFFGADLSLAIRKNGWVRVPEWTGVWGKKT